MARARSPFAGTYRPASISFNKEELMKGLKGIEKKIKTPNKHLTTMPYKASLRKVIPTPKLEGE